MLPILGTQFLNPVVLVSQPTFILVNYKNDFAILDLEVFV